MKPNQNHVYASIRMTPAVYREGEPLQFGLLIEIQLFRQPKTSKDRGASVSHRNLVQLISLFTPSTVVKTAQDTNRPTLDLCSEHIILCKMGRSCPDGAFTVKD